MSDFDLTMSIGYNPQQLESVKNKMEEQLSEVEATVKLKENDKSLVAKTKRDIQNIISDASSEFKKLEPEKQTGEALDNLIKGKLDNIKESVKDIASITEKSLGADSPLSKGLLQTVEELSVGFQNATGSVRLFLDAFENVGEAITSTKKLKESYSQMIEELKELKTISSSESMIAERDAFIGTIKNAEQAKAAFTELRTEYQTVQEELAIVTKFERQTQNNPEEYVKFRKKELELRQQELAIALKIEALQSKTKSKEVTGFKFGSDKLLGRLENIRNYDVFADAIEKLSNEFLVLNDSIGLVLSKEMDLAGITNSGLITVAARLEITTTKEQMVDVIKNRLLEVQQAILDEEQIFVPVKLVFRPHETDSLKKMDEPITLELGDSLKEVNNLSDAVVLLAGEIEALGNKSKLGNLDEIFSNIKDKVSGIRQAVDNINVKENVVKSFKNLHDALSVLSNSKLKNFSNFANIVKTLSTVDSKTLTAMFSSFRKVRTQDIENIAVMGAALSDLKKELDELDKDSFSGFLAQLDHILQSTEALKALATVVQKTGTNLEKVSSSLTNVDKSIGKPVEKIKASLEGLERESNISNYLGDYTGKLNALKSKITEFEDEVERINKIPSNLLFNSEKQANDTRLRQMVEDIKEMNYQLQESEVRAKSPAKENAIKKLNKFLADSTKLTKEEREQIDALITRINNPNLSIREFKEIMTTFNEISSNAIRAGRATSSFFDAIRNKLKYGWAQSIAQFFSFYDILRYVREISGTITELNSSLIELSKVSNTSIGELYNQFSEFNAIAKETGGTVNDIIKLTSSWARNGYNLADSKELARLSSIFQNIGDGLSADQSNEYLVSTLKGFNLEASQAIEIMDKINNVSNNAASSVSDIGEALERSSASFGAANTSLSEAVALITKANEVVQNPETVGTAFKSLSARLRGSTTELEELGEETTVTTSKLRDLVQALTGVDIQQDENTFKSIYDILYEIGKEWNNLTDVEQASLSEALFG